MRSHKLDSFFDLLLVLFLVLLSIIFVLIEPFNQTPLRIIFALPILLFLPGYVLIATMFSRKQELSGIERFTLSVGLSIAIFVFDGFAVSVTAWKFRPDSIVLSLTGITLLLTLTSFVRRIRLSKGERYFFGPSTISEFIESIKVKEEPTDIEKALIIALVGSIIIASGMLVFAKLTREEEKFTELYILGEGGKAEGYPSELYILEQNPIIVGVENHEQQAVNYTLRVKMGDYLLEEKQISLGHKEKWKEELDLNPRHLGRHLKLEFALLREESTSPYRSVHLWVDSVVNYDNLDRVREYALSDLPQINNSNMESSSGWKLDSNTDYFRGYYSKFHQVVENCTLQGYVVSGNTSEPIPDARISVTNQYETQKTVNADGNGTYSLSLPSDHYWITVNAKGYQKNETEIDLNGSKSLNLTTFKPPKRETYEPLNRSIEELSKINESMEEHPEELHRSVSILKGFAVNHNTGETIPNASITVEHELGFVQTTQANESGYYEIKVISGKHRIETRAEGYVHNTTSYQIGSIHELNLNLIPLSCKVEGYVFDENGKPVPDAQLRLRSERTSDSTRSNLTGHYEMITGPGEASLSASKRGYFDNSSEFNLTAYSTKVVNMTLVNIPPPSIVEGHVSYDGKSLSGIKVVVRGTDLMGNPIEKSTTTDLNGHFNMEVMPGNVYLDVLQGYMKENISFYAKSNKKANFEVELDSNPYSNYKLIYPSQTPLQNGFSGGISQIVNTDEGLASLSFKVKGSGSRSSDVVKQVVLNDTVIWEDSFEGNKGWQEVEIPITFDSGPNKLLFRAYAKKDSNGPLTVLWDDIEIGSIHDILKEEMTKFKVLDSEGGNEYPHNLYLGQPVEFIASVENNEQQEVNYTLQVKLGGVTHHNQNILLEDNETWEKRLKLTPSVLGDFMKLEFLLFKDSQLYKHKDLWVSSELKDDEDILKRYSVPSPEIEDWDMESSGWSYGENDANFSGKKVSDTFVSPHQSYEISTESCGGDCYGEIKQNITLDAPANVVIFFNVKDSYRQPKGGNYYKQVLVDDNVVWEDDVAGDEGWLYENIPVTVLSSNSSLKFRVRGEESVSNSPIKVWWDNIKIKPLTEYQEGPTLFSVLDARGGEDHPQTLYLGKPTNYTIRIENYEQKRMEYRMGIKLDGELIKTQNFTLANEEIVEENVSVIPEVIGDDLKLEFILYREDEDEPYRYFSSPVSSKIDYSDPEVIRDYFTSVPPSVKNGDMEYAIDIVKGWDYDRYGKISFDMSTKEHKEGKRSLRIYQTGEMDEEEKLSVYQEINSVEPGYAFLTWSVKDNFNEQNETGLMKQVLVDEEIIWEDDVAHKEGWETINTPVNFSITNTLTLRVYASQSINQSDISVYWDNIDIKSLSEELN
ncbi:MAG: DUF1616 domain-containing protein [Archaeoglobaceae archaeon]